MKKTEKVLKISREKLFLYRFVVGTLLVIAAA